MSKRSRWSILFVVAVLAVAFAAQTALAETRSIERKAFFVGGSGTRSDNDGSFKLSYLEVKGEKGRLTFLTYQISSLKDTKLLLRDVEYLVDKWNEDDQKWEQKVVWKQSGEETLDFYIDNLDPDPKTVKVYDKRKYFTDQEIPYDQKTGVVRWKIWIAGKLYNFDWNLKANEFTYEVAD